ncbi:glutathione S-transferase family protein [Chroococcus sp. FPU101]|uniref:glutathione S-transferase family protein n=1 Tax=Chroococcus sp. FPU101 TaxID=1974212 RepID=UPI001A8E515D|nr:glutathione S-transferase family protein [Chroococcus sp. FPU101]GFE72099.1 glutathione S-transferase domain-containing protein [Chroococcus sp. FPU101]
MIKLYGHELSGNSYKVKLMLSLLNLDYEWIKVDLMTGAHKKPDFLALNPFGQVPVLVDGNTVLADAQAILLYLARQYGNQQWLPLEAEPMSRVIRWLSTTAGEVRQGLESARLYHLFKATSIDIERATQKSEFILAQLNNHLQTREWLELGHPTIADVAVFPYIALASDAKIALDQYPNVLAWIERIKQLPNFVCMIGIEQLTKV